MTVAKVEIHAEGINPRVMANFELDLHVDPGDSNLLVASSEGIIRGLALAMRGQVDRMRAYGIPQSTITGLLIDVWPFPKEES